MSAFWYQLSQLAELLAHEPSKLKKRAAIAQADVTFVTWVSRVPRGRRDQVAEVGGQHAARLSAARVSCGQAGGGGATVHAGRRGTPDAGRAWGSHDRQHDAGKPLWRLASALCNPRSTTRVPDAMLRGLRVAFSALSAENATKKVKARPRRPVAQSLKAHRSASATAEADLTIRASSVFRSICGKPTSVRLDAAIRER